MNNLIGCFIDLLAKYKLLETPRFSYQTKIKKNYQYFEKRGNEIN